MIFLMKKRYILFLMDQLISSPLIQIQLLKNLKEIIILEKLVFFLIFFNIVAVPLHQTSQHFSH